MTYQELKDNNWEIDIPEITLSAFAKYLTPEIHRFYNSEEGQAYYQEWLKNHPEYKS